MKLFQSTLFDLPLRCGALEESLEKEGVTVIVGVDEAGRGPLAGPVVTAAVCLGTEHGLQGLDDSKRLTAARREALFDQIKASALAYAIHEASPKQIDELNILQATLFSMRESVMQVVGALRQRTIAPAVVVVDGNQPLRLDSTAKVPERCVVKGDQKSTNIAAASILAKVHRDRLMAELDVEYPGYGLAEHKGYPTKSHKAAIAKLGPSIIHRTTFRGVKEHLTTSQVDPRHELGALGENLAANHLIEAGYEIVERNWRCDVGELDIIAEKGEVLAIVEVRTVRKGSLIRPEDTVIASKQRRVERAFGQWMLDQDVSRKVVRFDVIGVEVDSTRTEIRHHLDAFRARTLMF